MVSETSSKGTLNPQSRLTTTTTTSTKKSAVRTSSSAPDTDVVNTILLSELSSAVVETSTSSIAASTTNDPSVSLQPSEPTTSFILVTTTIPDSRTVIPTYVTTTPSTSSSSSTSTFSSTAASYSSFTSHHLVGSGLSVGAIIGISVGAAVGFLTILAALIICCLRSRKRRRAQRETTHESPVSPQSLKPAVADGAFTRARRQKEGLFEQHYDLSTDPVSPLEKPTEKPTDEKLGIGTFGYSIARKTMEITPTGIVPGLGVRRSNTRNDERRNGIMLHSQHEPVVPEQEMEDVRISEDLRIGAFSATYPQTTNQGEKFDEWKQDRGFMALAESMPKQKNMSRPASPYPPLSQTQITPSLSTDPTITSGERSVLAVLAPAPSPSPIHTNQSATTTSTNETPHKLDKYQEDETVPANKTLSVMNPDAMSLSDNEDNDSTKNTLPVHNTNFLPSPISTTPSEHDTVPDPKSTSFPNPDVEVNVNGVKRMRSHLDAWKTGFVPSRARTASPHPPGRRPREDSPAPFGIVNTISRDGAIEDENEPLRRTELMFHDLC